MGFSFHSYSSLRLGFQMNMFETRDESCVDFFGDLVIINLILTKNNYQNKKYPIMIQY